MEASTKPSAGERRRPVDDVREDPPGGDEHLRDLLRRKAVDEGLTPQQIARDLGWEIDEVHRLLGRHGRHLSMARLTRRFGGFLTGFYVTTALNVLITVMSVLLGFWLASAWADRQDSLKEMRSLLIILRPLHDEVATLSQRAQGLRGSKACDLEQLKYTRWKSIESTNESLLLNRDLYRAAQNTFDKLAGSLAEAENLQGGDCGGLLTLHIQRLESLRVVLDSEIRRIRGDHDALHASQERGLRAFVEDTLGSTPVLLVLIPVAVYGLMIVATRLVR